MHQGDASGSHNEGEIKAPKDVEMKDQPDSKSSDKMIDAIKMEITDPDFKVYLEETGALEAINGALTSLYIAEPKPLLPKHFISNEMAFYCDLPPDPLMELITARNRIKELEKEVAAWREKVIASIQARASKRNRLR